MFDITIVSQSFLYRIPTEKGKAGKRSFRAGRGTSGEEECLLSAGATGTDEGTPQHRRRTVSDTDDNV